MANRIVYSTDGTRAGPPGKPNDGIVRVAREKAGRRGKVVTIISGIGGGEAKLQEVAGTLKRAVGSGGTVAGDLIEIQGDHRDVLAKKLTELGYRVKIAGG